MNFLEALEHHPFLLTEAAVIESLRRDPWIPLHPRLEHALLVMTGAGRQALAALYDSFMDVADSAGVPLLLGAPTWRANVERLAEAGVAVDVNGDGVRFLKTLRSKRGNRKAPVYIAGLLGCRNDSYLPDESLTEEEAEVFHMTQAEKLAAAHPDFLLAATQPSVTEARGLARALSKTEVPYLVSFVIGRDGRVLDGTSLNDAVRAVDRVTEPRPPAGFQVNCAFPTFLDTEALDDHTLTRIIGFQGNSSSRDQAELDGSKKLEAESLADWGEAMIALYRKTNIKILGGCCGTTVRHLRYLVEHLSVPGET